MRTFRRLPKVLILALGVLAPGNAQQDRHVAKTVTILPLGSSGETFRDCRVSEFSQVEGQKDFAERFCGLAGNNIPFGEYWADVRCSGFDKPPTGKFAGTSSIVRVNTPDALVVVSSAVHAADFVPGSGPNFHVSVSDWLQVRQPVWTQLVGVFVDVRVEGRVNPKTGTALLPIELPGAYVLTLFEGGGVVCRQSLHIDNVGGDISVKLANCVLLSSRGVALEGSGEPLKH